MGAIGPEGIEALKIEIIVIVFLGYWEGCNKHGAHKAVARQARRWQDA